MREWDVWNVFIVCVCVCTALQYTKSYWRDSGCDSGGNSGGMVLIPGNVANDGNGVNMFYVQSQAYTICPVCVCI